MSGLKQDVRTAVPERHRASGLLSRMSSLLRWDPFDDIPTEEEYLAVRAYRNLLEATRSVPPDKRAEVRGRVARNLIKSVCENKGGHKQAVEMWKVFHRRLPRYVTDGDYPSRPEA